MKYEQILAFLNAGSFYGKSHNDKLSYAIKKVTGRLKDIVADYNELVDDVKIDCASVDEKGNMIVNGDSYVFTPAKRKEFNKAVRVIGQKEVTETFEPYYATEVPEDLDEDFIELFKGFVIK